MSDELECEGCSTLESEASEYWVLDMVKKTGEFKAFLCPDCWDEYKDEDGVVRVDSDGNRTLDVFEDE